MIAPKKLTSLLAMPIFAYQFTPAHSASLLDFFENFQTTEVIVEDNFSKSHIDSVLFKFKHRDRRKSAETEAGLKLNMELELKNESQDKIISKFLENGAVCRSSSLRANCRIIKYEITRPPGNSDLKTCRRLYKYDFEITTHPKSSKKFNVKYEYNDSSCE